jgi:transposase
MTLTHATISAAYAAGEEAVVCLVEQLVAHTVAQEAQIRAQQEQIAAQQQVMVTLSARVKELEDRGHTSSHNSSKPPSSDGLRRPPRSLRQSSGKKPGGQPGHVGSALHMVEEPDHVITHSPPVCAGCQASLADVAAHGYERRQVLDLPPRRLEATEHRAEEKTCPACQCRTRGMFPSEVTTRVQYGPQLKALLVYLLTYQLLPFERASEVVADLFGAALSEGTLQAAVETCAETLTAVETQINEQLCAEAVLHNDETGVRVAGKLLWLHVASTAQLTHYAVHAKRGSVAMTAIGILPTFEGTSVHDGLAAYRQYGCGHGLCNAHHLRELTAIEEHDHQPWATQMKELLVEIKDHVAKQRAAGQDTIAPAVRQDFVQRYQEIVAAGLAANPPPDPGLGPPKRGRVKQSKAKNLLDRLRADQAAVLAFMDDWRVPFDNNQAERDLRMVKVQQKVSGCFRTIQGAETFCRVRGYLSTLRKHGEQLLPALHRVFTDHPLVPSGVAGQ